MTHVLFLQPNHIQTFNKHKKKIIIGFLNNLFRKRKPPRATKQISDPTSNIESKLNKIVCELSGIEEQIVSNSTFEDLGLDSLDVVEMSMAAEEEFNIEIPDEDIEKIKYFNDAVKYLEFRLKKSNDGQSINWTELLGRETKYILLNINKKTSITHSSDPFDITRASMVESIHETISYNGGPVEFFYEQMSLDLINRHGSLVGVDYMSHFPKFEIYFAYEDDMRIYSGQRTGHYNIHFLSLGYAGEGPRYAKHFLAAAGFDLTYDQIKSIKPGDSLKLSNEVVVIQKKEAKVNEDDLGLIKFSHERNELVSGAPATYRHYTAPDKKIAKKFLDKQNITAQSYFVVVETPEGDIAKDRMGTFEP